VLSRIALLSAQFPGMSPPLYDYMARAMLIARQAFFLDDGGRIRNFHNPV
jgi:hypothetical protein